MTFAERLKKYREKAGLSQTDVAARLNVPLSTYHSYEKKGTLPNVEMLLRMAYALGCTVDELAGYEPPEFDAEAIRDYLLKFGSIQLDCTPDAKDDDMVKVSLVSGSHVLPGLATLSLSQVKDYIRKSEREADAAVSEQKRDVLKGRLFHNLIISPTVNKQVARIAKYNDTATVERLKAEQVEYLHTLYLAIMETMKTDHEDGKGGADT